MYKNCTKCGEEKSSSNFYKSRKNGLQAWCKSCMGTQTKEWHTNNKGYSKGKTIESRYGITVEEYNKAMATSDKCEICGSQNKLCYDHCHDTMKFRGVLCSNCNLGLGKLGDSLEAVMKAVKYLTKETK